MIDRKSWGAAPPSADYTPMNAVKRIVIHHSATSPDIRVKNIQYYHMHDRGWIDIGYHFLVDSDGNIYEGRPTWAIGSHCGHPDEPKKDWLFGNAGSLGICVVGHYDAVKPLPKAIEAIKQICSHYLNVPVIGHFETWVPGRQKKTCPGKYLSTELFGQDRWDKYFGGKS